MPVQSSSHCWFGSGLSPLRMSQTRTPWLVAQPMFFEGIWKVGDLSAGWDVEIIGSGSRVTVTTVVSVLGGGPATVTVSVVPPPHAATATTSTRRKISRPTHGSLVLHVAHLAMTAAPLLSRLRAEACVLLELERPQLASVRHIAVVARCLAAPVRDRSPHRTIGLLEMRAVREATIARDLDDLRKR